MQLNDESGRNKRTAIVAAVLGSVLVLFALSSSVALELLTGWFHFAIRVLPKVRVRWDGIAVFTIGTLFACALSHFFLRWLVRESQLRRSVPVATWRVSSSVSLVAILLFIFAIGISMAGIVHQVGWIMNSPKGLYTTEVQTEEDASRSPYKPEIVAVGNQVSWIFESLIYIGYMRPEIDRSQPWNGESNKNKVTGLVPETLCPSQGFPHKSLDGLGLTHIVGNREVTEHGRELRLIDFESASQTIMAGEIQIGFSPWAMPNNGRLPKHGIRQEWSQVANGSLGFGSSHNSGANMLMVDDSVLFLSNQTDPKVLEQLGQLKVKKNGND